jgi:flavodoxin I
MVFRAYFGLMSWLPDFIRFCPLSDKLLLTVVDYLKIVIYFNVLFLEWRLQLFLLTHNIWPKEGITMAKVGIFFGTDTGSTRRVAKLIYKQLEEIADKPVNVNRIDATAFEPYQYLILGTPTLGEGQLPGLSADCQSKSWEEFIPNFATLDLTGKKVALFGLGDQVNYSDEFVDALGELYDYVVDAGAEIYGFWPTQGYEFNASNAVDGDQFVGLVIDKDNQSDLTEQRIAGWVEQIKSEMAL